MKASAQLFGVWGKVRSHFKKKYVNLVNGKLDLLKIVMMPDTFLRKRTKLCYVETVGCLSMLE